VQDNDAGDGQTDGARGDVVGEVGGDVDVVLAKPPVERFELAARPFNESFDRLPPPGGAVLDQPPYTFWRICTVP
jgi:hypothetical protein